MNKKILFLSLLILINFSFHQLNSGRGGAIAGGILGAAILAPIVYSAVQPRYVERGYYDDYDYDYERPPVPTIIREIHYVKENPNDPDFETDTIRTTGY